jgi:hypothetical protein
VRESGAAKGSGTDEQEFQGHVCGQSGQSNQSVTYVRTAGLGQSRQSDQSVMSVEALTALGYK